MPTVADLSKKFEGVVLLHWHPPCLFVKTDPRNHPEDIYGQSHEEALFRRLTHQTHRRHLIPTRKSRRLLRDQADRLVELGTVPDRIAHGQHRLAERGAEEFVLQLLRGPRNLMRESREQAWLNPPTYVADGLRRVINRDGMFVRYWFNGRYELGQVALENPDQWLTAFVDEVDDELQRGGVSLLFTHYEQLVAAHAFFIANQEPPSISDSWSPDFGGGIAVYDDEEQFRGAVYDEMFNLV